jgi:hypothetical protein
MGFVIHEKQLASWRVQMSENASGVTNVRREIAIIAGPKDWGDTRESWLARVPRKVKTVSFRTVKALWYGEIHDDNHWAARDIKRAAEHIEFQKEAQAHADRIQTAITHFRHQDAEFYGEEIARLERVISRIRAVDRT